MNYRAQESDTSMASDTTQPMGEKKKKKSTFEDALGSFKESMDKANEAAGAQADKDQARQEAISESIKARRNARMAAYRGE